MDTDIGMPLCSLKHLRMHRDGVEHVWDNESARRMEELVEDGVFRSRQVNIEMNYNLRSLEMLTKSNYVTH